MAKKIKAETKTEKKPLGRPSSFTQQIADRICRLIATNTCGLKRLCFLYPDLPSHATISEWRLDFTDFSGQYARAKQLQSDLLAEEIIDIADDGSNDYYENPEGIDVFDSEHVQRSRVRIDTRKWLASKLMPKVYGDKVQSEVTLVSHEEALKKLI